MLKFNVLGPLEVLNGDKLCGPTAPRALGTLALLVVRANYVVPMATMIEELWNENPPRSAATTAQTYVYQLRRMVDEEACGETGKEVLITKAPGYTLRVEPDSIDLFRFQNLVTTAQSMLDTRDGPDHDSDHHDPEQAALILRQALDLWVGPALANVKTGPVLDGYAAALQEEYARALNLRIEADLQLGRLHELIPELQTLVVEQPYNEWYRGLLVFALARIGRRNDALHVYAKTRRVLADDLGLAPCGELQRMHAEVLRDGDIQLPHPMASLTHAQVA